MQTASNKQMNRSANAFKYLKVVQIYEFKKYCNQRQNEYCSSLEPRGAQESIRIVKSSTKIITNYHGFSFFPKVASGML